eukprot:TRINITY_DN57645_c0_g1_i1.p1 TRINITY_DN57645_c0_g1~~TRINITY_DN57645_c0_g1_i1.p1  ORF type:complete len:269 (+),score=35.52 TRINITY_DN57645_c0_g1_i1:212-1018(+)
MGCIVATGCNVILNGVYDGPLITGLKKAISADGQVALKPVIVKILKLDFSLENAAAKSQEKRACQELKHIDIVPCEVTDFRAGDVDDDVVRRVGIAPHSVTGAIVMSHYPYSVAMAPSMSGMPEVLLREGRRIEKALKDGVHAHGWVHMDVKSENILVRPDGRWVLCDLGSAAKEGDLIFSSTKRFYFRDFPREEEGITKSSRARPSYDWYMLAVTMLRESLPRDTWYNALFDGPAHVSHVKVMALAKQEGALYEWVRELLQNHGSVE